MNRVLSFSLFGNENRYWQSLPSCLIAYNYAYPEYDIHLYLDRIASQHLGFEFLNKIQINFDSLKIIVNTENYTNFEPTIWRMKPMWENGIELFFCRDIDAIPTSSEKKATEAFINSRYAIHGIRSYRLHNTDLMAGLCGFKSHIIRKALFCNNFNDYRNFAIKSVPLCANWEWGCDQHLLRKFFFSGNRGRFCTKMALDSMVGDAEKVSWYRGNHLSQEIYDNIDVTKYNDLWAITDNFNKFLAEPSHFNSGLLNQLFKLNSKLSNVIKDILLDEKYKYFLEK